MKLPEVLFVKHCPQLAPERKVFLEKHLEERVPIKDIRWIEDYNYDHPFIEWLNVTQNLPYGVKLTSNLVKTLFTCKQMIEENIEAAIFTDDDITFHHDWVKYFESIPDDINKVGFVNLGTSYMYNKKPVMNNIYAIANNGGCECAWLSLNYVKGFMSNLNLGHGLDIIWHAYLCMNKLPLLYQPIAHQTSTLTNFTTLDKEQYNAPNWIEFIKGYNSLEKVDFDQLLTQYEEFKILKKKKEEKFFELFGKRVDIKNVHYVNSNTQDFNFDILTY